jgi:hypothetical protein
MATVLQLIGAILVLVGFAGVQFGWTRADAWGYLVVNTVGSAILAGLALADDQWGFLLLEGVWALVSAWGLFAKATNRPVAGDAH